MKHLNNTDQRTLTRAAVLGLSAAALLGLTACHSTHGNNDRNRDRDAHHDDQYNRSSRNTDRDHHDDRSHDRPRR